MKKILSVVIASALLLTSCGTQSGRRSVDTPTGANMKIDLEHAWAGEPIRLDTDGVPNDLTYAGGWLFAYCLKELESEIPGQRAAGYSHFAACNLESGETVIPDGPGAPIGVGEAGGMIQIFWSESAYENGSWTEENYTLVTYDQSMQEVASEDVSDNYRELAEDENAVVHLTNWFPTGDGGQLVSTYNGLYYYDADGQFRGEVTGNFTNIIQLFRNEEGRIFATGAAGSMMLAEVFPEKLCYTYIDIPDLPEYITNYAGGYGGYDWYAYDAYYLYGVKDETQTVDIVADWESSDLTGLSIRDTISLPDGRFIVSQGDWFFTYNDLYCIRERTQEELDSMECITLATYQLDDYLQEMIHRYNRQSERTKIVVKTYVGKTNVSSEQWEAADKAFSAFQTDLINGIIPDIVCMNNADYEMLSNKGLFEDLRPWMEDDPAFREEDYFMNFLESLDYKGALERMAFSYELYAVAAKSEFVGTEGFCLTEDYTRLAQALPEGMTLFQNSDSRSSVLMNLVTDQLESWLDYEKGESYFDSAEFVQLLELCARCSETPSQLQDDYAYRKNEALLFTTPLASLQYYHEIKATYFDNAPVTLLGLPQREENGNGGIFEPQGVLAVTANSLHKAEIWEFIKFCLQEENQCFVRNSIFALPVNRAALQSIFEQEEADEPSAYTSFGGQQVNIGLPTPEEAQELTAFIEGARVSTFRNQKLLAIVEEEAGMFLAGDCTAEESAKSIQGRISLYLAEQK